jgi:hypothetical protein
MYWVKHKIIEIFKFNRYLIAVGLESGEILLYAWKLTDRAVYVKCVSFIQIM